MTMQCQLLADKFCFVVTCHKYQLEAIILHCEWGT